MNKVLRKNSGGYKMTSRLVGRMPSHGEDARCRNMTARKREGIKQMRRFLANDLMDEVNDLLMVDDQTIENSVRKSMWLSVSEIDELEDVWYDWMDTDRYDYADAPFYSDCTEDVYYDGRCPCCGCRICIYDEPLSPPINTACPDCGKDMCDCHVYYY